MTDSEIRYGWLSQHRSLHAIDCPKVRRLKDPKRVGVVPNKNENSFRFWGMNVQIVEPHDDEPEFLAAASCCDDAFRCKKVTTVVWSSDD